MTIAREQVRDLAAFEDPALSAISFYFQPATPRNKSHKEHNILIKDLAREAVRNLEARTENKEARESARADIDRILRISADLRSNGVHAKAVFACGARNLWHEYDLPPTLSGTHLFVDRRFHLKPIAHLLGAFPSLGVVLADRHRARIFDLRLGELTEREDLFHPLTRRGRSDGFGGYDAGHAERRVEDETRQHFKTVTAMLKEFLEKGVFEKWILGCLDELQPQLESQLHPYVSQALLGHFNADVQRTTGDEIRMRAQQIVDEWQNKRRQDYMALALSQARSHGRGVTGLRRVLRALEMGEVQALLIGENFQSHAVECSHCGHLDAHVVNFCPVCGHATREIVDVGEAILPRVIRGDIETFYVKDDPEFDQVGNIAALLRFRVDHAQPMTTAASSTNGVIEYPGRLRRFAS
jgi:peptide subunit release factor 1 (eRF1)